MKRDELISETMHKHSFLCIGLDGDLNKLPEHLLGFDDPLYEFNRAIVDATAGYCVAYKPNLAFYEQYGSKGWRSFVRIVEYIREHYPSQFIIADAKRGDIGNTSAMYARAFFEHMDVDAVTLAPYMGRDSVQPFLDYDDQRWAVILALTSNGSASDFEMLKLDSGERLYERVLRTSSKWGSVDNTMYVVGATKASELANVRAIVPNHFLLVPGVGAQGGSLEDVYKYGANEDCGLLVNSSRGIIYASRGADFDSAAAAEAQKLQSQMRALLLK